MDVEVARIGRFGMDEQASTSDVRGQFEKSSNDILEKSDAEPPALMIGVDAETGEQRNGLRIAPAPLWSRTGAARGRIWAMHQAS